MIPNLTIDLLCKEASTFAKKESQHKEKSLYGRTDGKAVGTYLEHKFRKHLRERYDYIEGSSASGIDFPELDVDMKVTRITQPQSSCPYKSAKQKIYGLGYSLIVFVYQMVENSKKQTVTLDILHIFFIEKEHTADYQTTTSILEILDNDGNQDDVVALLLDKNLPIDEIGANHIAKEILNNPPKVGYLTISNALQWRLQYRRALELAGKVEGIRRIS